MYEILDKLCILEPTSLDVFSNLERFPARFRELTKIAANVRLDKCISYPLNSAISSFDGT